MPFLRNVTRGRGIPDERLEAVGEHYRLFGGRSPINDQNRALLAALRTELDARGIDLPLVWGNRNWAPYLVDTLREAHEAGARRALVVTTSAYSSYSGCRQYREDLADAVTALAAEGRALEVDQVRRYGGTSGFVEANADAVRAALDAARVPGRGRRAAAGLRHPLGADRDGRRVRSGRARVRRPARGGRCGRRRAGGGIGVRPRLLQQVRPADPAVARAGRQRPPGGARRSRHPRAWCSRRSGSSATTWRSSTTSTPRPRPPARGSGCGCSGRPRWAPTPGSCARWSTWWPSAAALGPGPTLDAPGLPSVHDVCPVGCCRNLRGDRPAACGADWEQPAVAGA